MRVSGFEWGLAVCVVLMAAVTYLQDSYGGVVATLTVIVAISVCLVVVSVIRSARSGVIGRGLLMAATFGFFWIEALSSARTAVPFEVAVGEPLSGNQVDLTLVKGAILFIALFQLMLLAGYSIRPPLGPLFRSVHRRTDERALRGRLWRYVLAACALVPILLSFNFDLGAATEALTGGRGTQNPAYEEVGLLHLLGFFGLYGASLLLVDALLFRGFSRWQQLVVGALATAPFILGGARHLWLFVAIPVGVVAYRVNAKKLTFARLAKWGIGLLGLLLILQVQLLVRDEGWSQITDLQVAELFKGDATGQFDAILVAESLVPAKHDYFYELAEPYFLIHWIPRRIWPAKPIMESWTYYNDQYTQGDIGFNVTPSVIGQFYINFGIFGVLYSGAFLGFLMITADRVLLRIDPVRQRALAVLLGSFIAFILVSYRFYSPIYFTYFAFALIGMLLITKRRPIDPRKTAKPPRARVGFPVQQQ